MQMKFLGTLAPRYSCLDLWNVRAQCQLDRLKIPFSLNDDEWIRFVRLAVHFFYGCGVTLKRLFAPKNSGVVLKGFTGQLF